MTSKAVQVHGHERKPALAPRQKSSPIFSLHREINRMFDDFFRGTELWPFEARELDAAPFTPGVDVIETEKDIRVKAELPGMEEKDVHVTLAQGTLTIKGEKKEEAEDKGKNYYRMERQWGVFYRAIPLPAAIDAGKAEASFKKGILTVTLPKTAEAKSIEKEIPVH